MVELNFDISADAVQERSFGPIPPGDYEGEIVGVDVKTSQAGNQYLSVQVRVEGKGSVWDNLNLWHSRADVVEIATRRLNEIGAALGMARIRDTDELLAKRVQIAIGLDKRDPSRNQIVGYRSVAGSPATTPVAAPAAPSPAAAAPLAASAAPAWRG